MKAGCDASDADQSLSMAKELIETYRMHPRISGCAAPHATYTCSPQILKKAWELDTANQVPFTLHAAEMDYEMTWLAQTRGCYAGWIPGSAGGPFRSNGCSSLHPSDGS
jgi:Cytosine deaminase and related metal-dependent hydrolases